MICIPLSLLKSSSGGMFVSKQYFDIAKLKAIDAKDLAQKLEGKTWENYGHWFSLIVRL